MRSNTEILRQRIGRAVNQRTELCKWFPSFLREPPEVRANSSRKALYWLMQLPVQLLIWALLRPRIAKPGRLDQREIQSLYTREAGSYDKKHHLTTRGQDTAWRRGAGWIVASIGSSQSESIRVLDLCTGTGLTVEEILGVASLSFVRVHIVALDYNEEMLKYVPRHLRHRSNVEFVRGDATALTCANEPTMASLARGAFDVVTQILGIGGIPRPLPVFTEVLKVLKDGGLYYVVDMHEPIRALPGEWPLFSKLIRSPEFEMYTYLHTTVPLALERLWAWRDTTLDFYLAPLCVHRDESGCWGFRIIERAVESERWWFGLPVMPTCKMLLRKERISESQYNERLEISDLFA